MIIKISFLFASFGGGLAVLLGAFGAHGMVGRIEENLIDTFQTGVQYQMYHCLALLLVAIMMRQWGRSPILELSCYAFMLGIFLFSGSLYVLALKNIEWVRILPPFGGLFFVVGWCALFFSCYQSSER